MIDPWTQCPTCESFGHHYIGQYHKTYLGHFLSQEMINICKVYKESDPLDIEEVEYAFFDRHKYAIHIERECIACGRKWFQLHEEVVL